MGKKILILDDDADLLEILDDVLLYEGFEPTVVESTNDLFSLVRFWQPALILIDFGLRGLDGGAWCTRLKNEPEFAQIPVIIFSAYSDKKIKKGSFGCNDFISKPFDLYDLIARITSLTDEAAARSATQQPQSNPQFIKLLG